MPLHDHIPLIEPCTFPNFALSAFVTVCALISVVDAALRDVDAIVARTRIATLLSITLHTALFVFDGNARYTVLATSLFLMYCGLVSSTLLYHCENFRRVYLGFPSESHVSRALDLRLLKRTVRMFPLFRGILVTLAVIESISVALYTRNITYMVAACANMASRLFCSIPTSVLMIRVSRVLRKNRVLQGGRRQRGTGTKVRVFEHPVSDLDGKTSIQYDAAQNKTFGTVPV